MEIKWNDGEKDIVVGVVDDEIGGVMSSCIADMQRQIAELEAKVERLKQNAMLEVRSALVTRNLELKTKVERRDKLLQRVLRELGPMRIPASLMREIEVELRGGQDE